MKENKVALNIAVVLLGVVLAAILIGGVVLGISNGTPKLKAKSIESNVKYKDSDEQSAADVAITGENFSITRGQAVPVEGQSDSETAENSDRQGQKCSNDKLWCDNRAYYGYSR